MEKKRKFRFVGDEQSIYWGLFEPNEVYNETYKVPTWRPVIDLATIVPEDWEDVTEQNTRIPNQDMPASSMTKFEMAVFMVLPYSETPLSAIHKVQETFKQLEKTEK